MARYETYHASAVQAPIMRRWILRALILSLLLHAGLFVFFNYKKLENFGAPTQERLAPPRVFTVERKTIDPKTLQDPDEVKTSLKEILNPLPKIEVPAETIDPSEVSVKPTNPEIVSPILQDRPQTAPINKDLLAKAEANSAGALDKELGSIASQLLKDSVKSPTQPVVITLPKGSKEVGGGVGENEGIPGLRSLDEAIAGTGPLASGDRLGVRGGALFEYDKADLLQQAIDDLQKLGELIRRNPRSTFIIEGHSDSFGDFDYNFELSQRRADAVKTWLVENMGVAPERVQTIGYGSTKPIAPVTGGINEQAPNRRVEILIKTNKGK